jgi:hypothetical protein
MNHKKRNLKIAEKECERWSSTTKCWVSDNLPQLPASERRAILKVYKKHFKTVDYDPISGICKCWTVEPYDLSGQTFGNFNQVDMATGSVSSDIKQSTYDAVGIDQSKLEKGTVIFNSDDY